jgi:hypothetical protein
MTTETITITLELEVEVEVCISPGEREVRYDRNGEGHPGSDPEVEIQGMVATLPKGQGKPGETIPLDTRLLSEADVDDINEQALDALNDDGGNEP